jgi:hypothetical protein
MSCVDCCLFGLTGAMTAMLGSSDSGRLRRESSSIFKEAVRQDRLRYPWEDRYQAAIEESDPKNLPRLIAFAETAIYDRLRMLEIEPGTIDERRAIRDALAWLALQRDRSRSLAQ